MHLIVVHNPDAGAGGWSEDRVERLLRDAGHSVHIVSSKKKNWRDLLQETPDAFVAAGGDGTVHKVVHGLLGRNVPVAILPFGTANNVAHAFGYSVGDKLEERIACWEKNERTFQIASVENDGRRRPFLETVGVGVFASMVRNSKESDKKSVPPIALLAIRKRLVELLLEATPALMMATCDGRPVIGEYLLVECLNLPWCGPRLHLAPQQSPDSGTVTLCGVPVEARETAAQWISTGAGDAGGFVLGHGAAVEIGTNDAAHVDGEFWSDEMTHGSPLRIQAAAHCARIWV